MIFFTAERSEDYVYPMKHWVANWAADLGQWAMVAPSFVSTKEQHQRVIQTLHRMNHFSLFTEVWKSENSCKLDPQPNSTWVAESYVR